MADVRLTTEVDTSGVASGMAAIENQVSKTASGIAHEFASMFAAGTIIAEFQKVINAADEIHKQSARFGIDAEEFQKVANAAKEVGIESDQVARTLNLMQINAEKALNPMSKQALAMESLGVSAKAFADASPWEKQLLMADAYEKAADKAKFLSDASEIVGKRNTEIIALWAQGRDKIQEYADKFPVLSASEIEALHELKVEEERYFANLDNLFAKAVVGWGRFATTAKNSIQDIYDAYVNGVSAEEIAQRNRDRAYQQFGKPREDYLKTIMRTPPAGPGVITTPTGGTGTEGAGGGGGGGGGGSDFMSGLTEQLQGLNTAEKLNEVLKARTFIQSILDSQEEQGDEHAASRAHYAADISKLDGTILDINKQLSLEEQKGVDAADRSIAQSQHRAEIDAMRFEAQRTGNVLLGQEADLLEIAYGFDEKIQSALDKANEARDRGLEQTARENELLAQQLEIEKQQQLAEQRRLQDLRNRAQVEAQIRDAAGALAQNNLRLGATSDVYAAALAASRGLQPGSEAYNRLVQQVTAQDMLRTLTGQTLGWEEQLNRDKLVQWYSGLQQNQATANANQSFQEQLAYWQALAAGRTPPASNPYTAFYAAPGSGAATLGSFGALEINTATTNTLLQQILARLTPTPGGV